MSNISIRTLFLVLFCSFAVAASPSATQPTLAASEKQEGWTLLFDGTTKTGWRGLGREGFPDDRWRIENGCLHCLGGPGKNDDLITARKYDNFELVFEWLVPKPEGNSGVKYRVQEKKGEGFAFGPEYQVMADGDASDKHATGSLYDVLPPHDKHLRPQGEFNSSRIVVRGNHVQHWLNGRNVLEFDFGSDQVRQAVKKSKFKNSPEWARDPMGYIALQDHHDEVWFRNLKIRQLKE